MGHAFGIKDQKFAYKIGISEEKTYLVTTLEVQKNLSCANFGDAFYGASNSEGPVFK